MTKITKNNVRETVEALLKELNVRYVVIDSDEIGCIYEVFVSSLLSYIQIEYNMKDDNDPSIVIQLYIKLIGTSLPIFCDNMPLNCQ